MSEVAQPVKVRHGRMKPFEILAGQTLSTNYREGGGRNPDTDPNPSSTGHKMTKD